MNTLKEICRNSGDYLIALIPYLAHVIAESEITEEIRTLRWDGLCKLHGQLRRYENAIMIPLCSHLWLQRKPNRLCRHAQKGNGANL